jgi:phosphatidylserine decarboxylase
MLAGMTRSVPGPLRKVTLGDRASRTLVNELARRPGPKTGLLAGATPGSATLRAAVDALAPEDSLVVTSPDPAAMRDHIAGLGTWVADRVRVKTSPGDADSADVVVLAEPLTGSDEHTRGLLGELAKTVRPGGVLAAATPAVPGLTGGAAAELARQAALFGAGSDLVLRNLPPVRIHRFRWSAPDLDLVERLEPVTRPSSVPLARDLHIDSSGVVAASIALGTAVLARLTRPRARAWLLPAAAALPLAAFFRDPYREPPEDRSLIVAASDGRVVSVEHVTDDRFSRDGSAVEYLRIAAFLSVLDVHVNRAPVAGTVVDHFREDGGYAPAMRPAAEHNVAAYTVLDTPRGRVAVAQRTGLLARRIVHRAPVGSLLARGERFGLIRFGSRTDVYLPSGSVRPMVAPGDRLLGGTTPLARWE